jgi:hypothetical protein
MAAPVVHSGACAISGARLQHERVLAPSFHQHRAEHPVVEAMNDPEPERLRGSLGGRRETAVRHRLCLFGGFERIAQRQFA